MYTPTTMSLLSTVCFVRKLEGGILPILSIEIVPKRTCRLFEWEVVKPCRLILTSLQVLWTNRWISAWPTGMPLEGKFFLYTNATASPCPPCASGVAWIRFSAFFAYRNNTESGAFFLNGGWHARFVAWRRVPFLGNGDITRT